jgi:hypothetical protein
MAQTTQHVRMTPLAALLDAGLRADKGYGLGTALAIARTPGPKWLSYEQIAELLAPYAAGRTLNRVSIKTFAEVLFKLPNTRYVLVDGKAVAMPKQVGSSAVAHYVAALDEASIDRLLVEALDIKARNDANPNTVEIDMSDAQYRDAFDDGGDQ